MTLLKSKTGEKTWVNPGLKSDGAKRECNPILSGDEPVSKKKPPVTDRRSHTCFVFFLRRTECPTRTVVQMCTCRYRGSCYTFFGLARR